MSSYPFLSIESPLSSSPQTPQSPQDVSPSPLPPETTKFLYSSLHRVDNLVRRYHSLRTESNSQANLLAHLSTRLALLAHSSLGPSVRTIDYDNSLRPPPKLSFADRMAISLKDNLDRCMIELDSSLTEMELVYMSVDDILITLCELVNSLGLEYGELVKGVKHVQQIYLVLVNEVRARRNLWYQFTSDEKRKSFMAASTLGDILLTPSVEWEAFANAWVALGAEEAQKHVDEVDELANAMGSWGKSDGADTKMIE